MFTEHFGKFLPKLLPDNLPLGLTYLGRIVAPIFFFLAVESYFKTSNKQKYIVRLYLLALVMFVGNLVVEYFVKFWINPSYPFGAEHNIFLTIAVGVSLIASIDWSRRQEGIHRWLGFGLALLLSVVSTQTEFSYYGLAMFLVFYFFYNKKPAIYWGYALISALILINALLSPRTFWLFGYQWAMIAALPLLMLYTGERGEKSFKHFFYIFYPLHLWILYIVSSAFGLR